MRRSANRILQSIFTIFVVITLSFVMIRLMPGGPMDYLRGQLLQQGIDESRVDNIVESYININPDEPVLIQYLDYITAVLQGDLGESTWHQRPVAEILLEALPWTIFIMAIALLVIYFIGIVIGAIIAYKEGTKLDYTVTFISILANSIPYYIAAIVLLFVLSYRLEMFPTGGRMGADAAPGFTVTFLADVLYHATLPILSMVITGFGAQTLRMRGNSIRVLGEDYLYVARLRGLSETKIAVRYIGRNSILPMYTQMMISIGFMFGGSVILEEIFRYRGIGYYMFQSISSRDYPLMMGSFIVITVAVVIAILITDLTYSKIDPRIGGESREAY